MNGCPMRLSSHPSSVFQRLHQFLARQINSRPAQALPKQLSIPVAACVVQRDAAARIMFVDELAIGRHLYAVAFHVDEVEHMEVFWKRRP